MTTRILTFLLLLIVCPVFGQLEASRWYFGDFAGLNFNEGCPDPLTNGELDSIESSTVISDVDGNLLFYSDGETVYNRNHSIMNNGTNLHGHKSSANGCIAIPFVGDPDKYYLFTGDAVQNYLEGGTPRGVNYSIIDMSLLGGLGAVTIKNVNLIPEATEKLTATTSPNGYWLIAHSRSDFYVYSINSGGIQPPVQFTFPPDIDDFNNIRGLMKLSPDGKKLAIAHVFIEPSLSSEVWLYDFNKSTGQITNPLLVANDLLYYGVEFSPNSEVLYIDGKEILGQETGDVFLYQYNLIASDVVSSRYLVTTYNSSSLVNLAGGLQTSIDTKLYQTSGGGQVSVVTKPNRLGENCNFFLNTVSLNNRNASLGLPNFVTSYYDNIVEYDDLCFQDQTQFRLNTSLPVSGVSWDFGDPESGADNLSNAAAPIHVFSSPGSYTVTTSVNLNGSQRVYETIVKVVTNAPAEGLTLSQCFEDIEFVEDFVFFDLYNVADLIFDPSEAVDLEISLVFYETLIAAQANQSWISDPSEYSIPAGEEVVIYLSIFRSLDCFRIVPLTLISGTPEIPDDLNLDICYVDEGFMSFDVETQPIRDLLSEVYPDEEIRLYALFDEAIAQINEVEDIHTVFTTGGDIGIYYRTGSVANCGLIGFVFLNLNAPEEIDMQVVTLCDPEAGVELIAQDGFLSYNWSLGEQTQSIVVDSPGNYEVELIRSQGCNSSQIFEVVTGNTLSGTFEIIDFQQNNQIIVNAESSSEVVLYSIDGGASFQQNNKFTNLLPGDYNVVVTNPDLCVTIAKTITVRGAPRYFTPNSDGYNDYWHVKNAQDYPGMKINIFDRFGKQITTLTDSSQGWDGVYNGIKQATNTYWYSINYEGKTTYGYFTLIKRGGL